MQTNRHSIDTKEGDSRQSPKLVISARVINHRPASADTSFVSELYDRIIFGRGAAMSAKRGGGACPARLPLVPGGAPLASNHANHRRGGPTFHVNTVAFRALAVLGLTIGSLLLAAPAAAAVVVVASNAQSTATLFDPVTLAPARLTARGRARPGAAAGRVTLA
jgi:hypothetical protein